MKKYIINKTTLIVVGLGLYLAIWFLIAGTVGNGSRIFPGPVATFQYTGELLKTSSTYYHLGWSFLRMLIGFIIGSLIGFVLGVFVGNFTKVKYVFKPTMVVLKTIPTAALVYLFLVLIGAKNSPIAIVALISLPIVYEATVAGFSNIEKNLKDALKMESKNFVLSNALVKIPLAAPYIVVGLISSFALSLKIEIMAEVISGSTSYGIGNIIKAKQQEDQSNLVPIFAYAFIAIVCILILSVILEIIKSKFKLDNNKA